MSTHQQLESFRGHWTRWLGDQGVAVEDGQDESSVVRLRETVLIAEGMYRGRRFIADGFDAVWFFEERQIKVRNATGDVVAVWEPETFDTPVRDVPEGPQPRREVPMIAGQIVAADSGEQRRAA